MVDRSASAVWTGGIKDGEGRLTTDSGVLADSPYSFSTRFENEPGTNPEELIGAAHAGCYSMALSKVMAEAGLTPERIETAAKVSLTKSDAGIQISAVHLTTRVTSPGADDAVFQEAAEGAKNGCPVSQVLNATITLDAALVG